MTAVEEGYCDLDQQRTVAEEGAEAAAATKVPPSEVLPLPSLGNEKVAAAAGHPWLSLWSCWQRKVPLVVLLGGGGELLLLLDDDIVVLILDLCLLLTVLCVRL